MKRQTLWFLSITLTVALSGLSASESRANPPNFTPNRSKKTSVPVKKVAPKPAPVLTSVPATPPSKVVSCPDPSTLSGIQCWHRTKEGDIPGWQSTGAGCNGYTSVYSITNTTISGNKLNCSYFSASRKFTPKIRKKELGAAVPCPSNNQITVEYETKFNDPVPAGWTGSLVSPPTRPTGDGVYPNPNATTVGQLCVYESPTSLLFQASSTLPNSGRNCKIGADRKSAECL